MEKKERMFAYLSTLYIPKDQVEEYSDCCQFIKRNDLRDVERFDEGKNGIDIIKINVRGKGKWASFAGYQILKADFNRIGDTYAEAYIYQDGYRGFPQRVFRQSSTFAIINK